MLCHLIQMSKQWQNQRTDSVAFDIVDVSYSLTILSLSKKKNNALHSILQTRHQMPLDLRNLLLRLPS